MRSVRGSSIKGDGKCVNRRIRLHDPILDDDLTILEDDLTSIYLSISSFPITSHFSQLFVWLLVRVSNSYQQRVSSIRRLISAVSHRSNCWQHDTVGASEKNDSSYYLV